MNKKAVALSINFLVTLILAITIFSFGIIFARNLLGGADELIEMTDSDLDKRIGSLLCAGDERVCYGIRDKTILRGEFDFFGVRVLNVLNVGMVEFTVRIIPVGFIRKGQSVIDRDISKIRLQTVPGIRKEKIDNNEDLTIGMGIEVPKDTIPGKYILDVSVTYGNDEQYDYNKVYVTVP